MPHRRYLNARAMAALVLCGAILSCTPLKRATNVTSESVGGVGTAFAWDPTHAPNYIDEKTLVDALRESIASIPSDSFAACREKPTIVNVVTLSPTYYNFDAEKLSALDATRAASWRSKRQIAHALAESKAAAAGCRVMTQRYGTVDEAVLAPPSEQPEAASRVTLSVLAWGWEIEGRASTEERWQRNSQSGTTVETEGVARYRAQALVQLDVFAAEGGFGTATGSGASQWRTIYGPNQNTWPAEKLPIFDDPWPTTEEYQESPPDDESDN